MIRAHSVTEARNFFDFNPEIVANYIKKYTNVNVVCFNVNHSTNTVEYRINADDEGIDMALRSVAVLRVKNVIPQNVNIKLVYIERENANAY